MNLPKIEVAVWDAPHDGLLIEIDSLERSGEPLAEWLCQHWDSETSITPEVVAWRRRGKKAAFLSRALAWVRLSDQLIASGLHNSMIFSRIDTASDTLQRDVARLIAFHRTQRIKRTFVLTTEDASTTHLVPELRVLLDRTLLDYDWTPNTITPLTALTRACA